MQAEITTIPELLIRTYGNMNEVSRYLGCYRTTVKKYAKDINGENHIIVNGRLMTTHKIRGKGTLSLAKELDSAASITKYIKHENSCKSSQINMR